MANYFSCRRKRSHQKRKTSIASETGAASGKTETRNELVLSLSLSGRVRWRLNTRFQKHHFTSILVEVDALSRPPQSVWVSICRDAARKLGKCVDSGGESVED
ncbi:hypothetical protein AVEN_90580-1 [Araneus ventricosus]|uniref:Uncharacterized protein n=1 Tax=Araneus ventricosus TaxID=182803 RepID=A0A4Y2UWS4_ARAVE|nr:hypothetical protein AVEN_90580-1 [Araneus ventricosus]